MNTYDIAPSSAEAAGSRWNLDQARDMQGFPARGLEKLLGSDVGSAVFASVREDVWEDWWNS